MKRLTLLSVALLAPCLPARTQVNLNAGDTYTYAFSSLPFMGTFIRQDVGAFVYPHFSSLDPSSQIRVEMFENTTADAPMASCLVTAMPFNQRCFAPSGWRDLQGAVRFTAVSGSAVLSGFDIEADQVVVAGVNVYSESVALVPEPTTLTLLGSAAGMLGVWAFRGRKPQHPA